MYSVPANKYEIIASPRLLQSLLIPSKVWKDNSMDYIMGPPPCHSKTVIMVVMDRLSKYSHVMALSHPNIVIFVVRVFIEHMFKLYWMLETIVSDKDLVFLDAF